MTFFVPSNAISHKNAWERYIQPAEKRFRKVAYNFYPRGRVVIRNGRGTVFLNQYIAIEEVLHKVCEAFLLLSPKSMRREVDTIAAAWTNRNKKSLFVGCISPNCTV